VTPSLSGDGDRGGSTAGPGPVDPGAPLPLWAQVETDLRRRLASGEFAGRLPTETRLMSEYGVSRSTVRQATRRLRDDGLLRARRGSGTYLTDPASLDESYGVSSLALTLRALGVEESSVVRTQELRPAAGVADVLGLERDDPVVYIERLRLGDGEPLALDRSWLPARIASPLLAVDLATGSLYAALASECGVRVTGGREEVRPAPGTREERELLQLPRTEALFARRRLALAGIGPVERRDSLMRGDRYNLLATWGSDEGRSPSPGPLQLSARA
jgi:GntR family transcriptional regulator